jgi:dihydroorotate dehydrogenase (fumarate)
MATTGATTDTTTDTTTGMDPKVDLATRYLGLHLRNPLVASPSPLSSTREGVRALADAGVGAVVLPSLFEEEVHEQQLRAHALTDPFEHAHGEADGYLPRYPGDADAATRYLRLVERAAGAVGVPVLASLNGSSLSGWTGFARRLQDAGAAAVELNMHVVPGSPRTSGAQVEERLVEILLAVKDAVTIPVAVKLSPYFSSLGDMAVRLDRAGADGLVLFNRFLHPDVDPERLVVEPIPGLSVPAEARLPRAWIAVLWSEVSCSLAATTGVEHARDVAAYLLAGADVVMTTSALLRHGARHATTLLDGLESWMRRKGFTSVDEARGRLAVPHGTDADSQERAGYVRALEAARHLYGYPVDV